MLQKNLFLFFFLLHIMGHLLKALQLAVIYILSSMIAIFKEKNDITKKSNTFTKSINCKATLEMR